MQSLPLAISNPSVLVVLAAGLHILAYLCRDQAWLRCLLLIGTGVYIAYYWMAGPTPLWSAILTTSLVASANLIGLMLLLISRCAWTLRGFDRKLYDMLKPVEPGQLRQLLRAGEVRRIDTETVLTQEGEAPTHLYFIVDGELRVRKAGSHFSVASGCFIGEVSLMLATPASGTVEALPGTVLVAWRRDRLERMMRRSLRLEQNLEAMLARDMAKKVASSSGLKPVREPAEPPGGSVETRRLSA